MTSTFATAQTSGEHIFACANTQQIINTKYFQTIDGPVYNIITSESQYYVCDDAGTLHRIPQSTNDEFTWKLGVDVLDKVDNCAALKEHSIPISRATARGVHRSTIWWTAIELLRIEAIPTLSFGIPVQAKHILCSWEEL